MTEYRTLADVDEAQRLIDEEAKARREELARERDALIEAADRARREAARERLTELNDELIPANTAKAKAAREKVVDLIAAGENPIIEALTTILGCQLADHALNGEAQNMEGTLGVPTRSVTMSARVDVLMLLADAITAAAESRTPQPVTLPTSGTPEPTHEELMFQARLKAHNDGLIRDNLGLTDEQVAQIDPDEYAAKVEKAKAEQARRQAAANRGEHFGKEERRQPGFRKVHGS